MILFYHMIVGIVDKFVPIIINPNRKTLSGSLYRNERKQIEVFKYFE